MGDPRQGRADMSVLRGFDPRRNRPAEPSTPPKVPKPPKEAAAAKPGLGALAGLGAGKRPSEPSRQHALGALAALGGSTDSREQNVVVADIIRRAENAFSPDAMADEAELCIRGERP
jgi:hypothetical protein